MNIQPGSSTSCYLIGHVLQLVAGEEETAYRAKRKPIPQETITAMSILIPGNPGNEVWHFIQLDLENQILHMKIKPYVREEVVIFFRMNDPEELTNLSVSWLRASWHKTYLITRGR
jgi:hypothetical protein